MEMRGNSLRYIHLLVSGKKHLNALGKRIACSLITCPLVNCKEIKQKLKGGFSIDHVNYPIKSICISHVDHHGVPHRHIT